jgi:putative ribosome biogenesis GTPase RsgA
VRAAVRTGMVTVERYDSYVQLLDELEAAP